MDAWLTVSGNLGTNAEGVPSLAYKTRKSDWHQRLEFLIVIFFFKGVTALKASILKGGSRKRSMARRETSRAGFRPAAATLER